MGNENTKVYDYGFTGVLKTYCADGKLTKDERTELLKKENEQARKELEEVFKGINLNSKSDIDLTGWKVEKTTPDTESVVQPKIEQILPTPNVTNVKPAVENVASVTQGNEKAQNLVETETIEEAATSQNNVTNKSDEAPLPDTVQGVKEEIKQLKKNEFKRGCANMFKSAAVAFVAGLLVVNPLLLSGIGMVAGVVKSTYDKEGKTYRKNLAQLRERKRELKNNFKLS